MLSCSFFFHQKRVYDRRIGDWSSDVCSSDLLVELVEEGLMAPKDPVFAERLGHNRARLETLAGRIAMLERQIGTGSDRITPELIERFGERDRKSTRLNSSH